MDGYSIRQATRGDATTIARLARHAATNAGVAAAPLETIIDTVDAMLATGFSDFELLQAGAEDGPVLGIAEINYQLDAVRGARTAYIRTLAAPDGELIRVLIHAAGSRASAKGCTVLVIDAEETGLDEGDYQRAGFGPRVTWVKPIIPLDAPGQDWPVDDPDIE